MKSFVNFDFDLSFLSKKINFNLKNQYNFEFIFFFLNEDQDNVLCSKFKYDPCYLSKLEKYNLTIPEISNDMSDAAPWWGNFEDFEDKKKFISKYNLIDTLSGTDLIPHFVKKIEIGNYNFTERMYYRSEYGFSGIANKVLDKDTEVYISKAGTISKYLKVEKSLGITVDLNNFSYFICTNSINESGNFLGGRVISAQELATLLSKSTSDIESELQIIFKTLKKMGAKGVIQFDSLVYEEDGKNHWYKVVEINYRKTMGLLIRKLTAVFGDGEYILSNKVIEDAILISPPGTKIFSYYRVAS